MYTNIPNLLLLPLLLAPLITSTPLNFKPTPILPRQDAADGGSAAGLGTSQEGGTDDGVAAGIAAAAASAAAAAANANLAAAAATPASPDANLAAASTSSPDTQEAAFASAVADPANNPGSGNARINSATLALIEQEEGFAANFYNDAEGQQTIGEPQKPPSGPPPLSVPPKPQLIPLLQQKRLRTRLRPNRLHEHHPPPLPTPSRSPPDHRPDRLRSLRLRPAQRRATDRQPVRRPGQLHVQLWLRRRPGGFRWADGKFGLWGDLCGAAEYESEGGGGGGEEGDGGGVVWDAEWDAFGVLRDGFMIRFG